MKSDHDKKDSLDELETFLKAHRDDQDKKMAPTLSKEAGIHFWNELKDKAKKSQCTPIYCCGG